MKKVVWRNSLLVICPLFLCHATWAADKGHDLVIHFGSESSTPFERLESLYNTGAPMQRSQFPAMKSPGFKNWLCTNSIWKETAVDDVSTTRSIPVIERAVVVMEPAVPARPAAGPEFQAQPARPQKNKYYDVIFKERNEISEWDLGSPTNLEWLGTTYIVQAGWVFSDSPGVSQTRHHPDEGDKFKNIMETLSYNYKNGLMIEKDLTTWLSQDGSMKESVLYAYCWRNP
jgi:hypothetical protein